MFWLSMSFKEALKYLYRVSWRSGQSRSICFTVNGTSQAQCRPASRRDNTRHILGHFGDGGVNEASARIVAAVSTEASSSAQRHCVCGGELCCATTVNNSGVYVCYLKGIVSVCFRCPARTVGFSGTRLYLCIYNQPSWTALKRYPPPG